MWGLLESSQNILKQMYGNFGSFSFKIIVMVLRLLIGWMASSSFPNIYSRSRQVLLSMLKAWITLRQQQMPTYSYAL